MQSGTVVAARDKRLFVVLASDARRCAVAPLRIHRARGDKRRAGDVVVSFCGMPATALCGAFRVTSEPLDPIGLFLAPTEISACQSAAERWKRERDIIGRPCERP